MLWENGECRKRFRNHNRVIDAILLLDQIKGREKDDVSLDEMKVTNILIV